jgi:predicted membrane channel-forming protein YqfA (hemolysin III family)
MGIVDNLSPLPRWTQSPAEERANTISHAIGLLAGLIATPVLVLAALDAHSNGFFVGTIVFATVLALVAGGIAYTAGVIFVVNERQRYNHFIWLYSF